VHRAERLGLNDEIAVYVSQHVGSMVCAYVFAGIGVGSIVFVLTQQLVLAAIFGSVSSYFLQLVLLPIIMVGQGVQGRHGEIQADESFHATMNTLHDAEQMAEHLDKQDREILRIARMLEQLMTSPAIPAPPVTTSPAVLPTLATTTRKPTAKKVSATNHA
jgi:hypothetical protein